MPDWSLSLCSRARAGICRRRQNGHVDDIVTDQHVRRRDAALTVAASGSDDDDGAARRADERHRARARQWPAWYGVGGETQPAGVDPDQDFVSERQVTWLILSWDIVRYIELLAAVADRRQRSRHAIDQIVANN